MQLKESIEDALTPVSMTLHDKVSVTCQHGRK